MEHITRIVLIGGPGTGKSTIIKALEQDNHRVHHEISREVTLEAQERGIDQLFLTDPMAFSNQLLLGRIKQFNSAVKGYNFYDRGIPDVPAYHVFTGDPIPDDYVAACHEYRYDAAFILPPWKEIYESDNERYESYEQAVKISNVLMEFYSNLNYEPLEVPKGTITDRVNFILDHI